jgi:hypothetical protein
LLKTGLPAFADQLSGCDLCLLCKQDKLVKKLASAPNTELIETKAFG